MKKLLLFCWVLFSICAVTVTNAQKKSNRKIDKRWSTDVGNEWGGPCTAQTWYLDADGDGYWKEGTGSVSDCNSPGTGYRYSGLIAGGDCNDNDNTIYPNAPEILDGKDNNCNGQTDESDATYTYYRDADGDGKGDPNPNNATTTNTSTPPEGYADNALDCNDNDPTNSPVRYVNATAAAGGNGRSWATAYKYLQDALAEAPGCITEIWVAKGTYYPDEGGGKVDNDRNAFFMMRNNLRILGGFAGTETAINQRNYITNETILSGNIGQPTDALDNSFAVVKNPLNGLNNTAILSGFVITGGYSPLDRGAGISNYGGSPVISDCLFTGNTAYNGAAAYLDNDATTFFNVTFEKNTSLYIGGAVSALKSRAVFTNAEFIENASPFPGGGIYAQSSSLTVTNSLYYKNSANEGGGFYAVAAGVAGPNKIINCSFSANTSNAFYISNGGGLDIVNSIVWGNTAGISDGGGPAAISLAVSYSNIQTADNSIYPGTGNINANPLFADGANGNLRLTPSSPSINSGIDAANTTTLDLDFDPRKFGTIDMGAYELQAQPCPTIASIATNITTNVACPGTEVILTASGLAGLGTTYGIAFKYFNAPTNDPYTGGTVIATVANGSLTDGGTVASTTTASLPSGVLYIYAVLSPAPANTACRTAQMVNFEVFTMPAAPTGSLDITNSTCTDCNVSGGSIGIGTVSGIGGTLQFSTNGGAWSSTLPAYNQTGPAQTILASVLSEGGCRSASTQVGVTAPGVCGFINNIIYVNANATGANNGTCWANAFTSLQSALTIAPSGYQIWVAKGTYTPSVCPSSINFGTCIAMPEDRTFVLKDGVSLYGGFAGTEEQLSERDIASNPTILNGDLGSGKRVYHVVVAANVEARLDGFTITGGRANGLGSTLVNSISISRNNGGGIYIADGNIVLAKNRVTLNSTSSNGGGIYMIQGTNTLSNNTLENNTADLNGGGIYTTSLGRNTFMENRLVGNSANNGGGISSYRSVNTLTKNFLSLNKAENNGGAIDAIEGHNYVINNILHANQARQFGGAFNLVDLSINRLINNTIWGNHAPYGGAIAVRGGGNQVYNSIIWMNDNPIYDPGNILSVRYSILQGFSGDPFSGNLNVDPRFADEDFRLQACSPAIDAGASHLVPTDLTTDFDGNARIVNATGGSDARVDMGAYEYQTAVPALSISSKDVLVIEGCSETDINADNAGFAFSSTIKTISAAAFEAAGGVIENGDCLLYLAYQDAIDTENSTPGKTVVKRTFRATDTRMKWYTYVQTITVQDTEQPTINEWVQGDPFPNDQGQCHATINIVTPPANDNCGLGDNVPVGVRSDGKPLTDPYPVGTTIITWTITDIAGNESAPMQMTIEVEDREKPTINEWVQGEPFPNDQGQCHATVSIDTPPANDNCDLGDKVPVGVRSDGKPLTDPYPVGTTIITWTITDIAGNESAPMKMTIEVVDSEKPIITCPQPVTVKCASDVPAPNIASVNASDNCGTVTVSVVGEDVITDQTCANRYTISRTYKATDAAGNSATCTQIITVYDDVKPDFTLVPANATYDCAENVPAPGTPTAKDNCDGQVVINYVGEQKTPGACVNQFTLVRTWTATDACGNESIAIQTIDVDDQVKPKIENVSVSQQYLWPVNHKLRDIEVMYTATDNCASGVTTTLTVTSNEPLNSTGDGNTEPDYEVIDNHHVRLRAERSGSGDGRVYTITITATDACGNKESTSTTVRVSHNITAPISGRAFKIGSTVSFAGTFWDVPGTRHTARWVIDGSTTTSGRVTAEPSGSKNGTVTGSYKFNSAGVYKLRMEVIDQIGNVTYTDANGLLDAIVVIYDPNGGYTYGGGSFVSPRGAMPANPNATGVVSYGFQNNYFKTATNPKGETQLSFMVGDFEFNALNYEYLAVDKYKAQFRGSGRITGGQSGISFIMTVIDGDVSGGGGVDKVRMKVFNKNTGEVYYDNEPGAGDASDPTLAVTSGSTVVIGGTESTDGGGGKTKPAISAAVEQRFEVLVANNPAPESQNFVIRLKSDDMKTPITLRISDGMGRVVSSYQKVAAGTTLQVGSGWAKGFYIAEAIQHGRRVTVKLLKQ